LILLLQSVLRQSAFVLLLALVVHSAPADDIVPESPEALTGTPYVSAAQEEPFENGNTNRDANSEVTNDIEDADIEDFTDEEDAVTSLAQSTADTDTEMEQLQTENAMLHARVLQLQTENTMLHGKIENVDAGTDVELMGTDASRAGSPTCGDQCMRRRKRHLRTASRMRRRKPVKKNSPWSRRRPPLAGARKVKKKKCKRVCREE
jgi:hypothetical protein